jgi:apolipoprotein N-acyltransferase
VLHGLSFPPTGLALLAWIAFVPWFAAIRLAGPGTALAITSFTTFAGSTVVASWLPRAVANYYGQPFALGVAFFVGVWVVTVAPFVLAFTVAYRSLARRAPAVLPLLAGAAWAATELCRVELLVGTRSGCSATRRPRCRRSCRSPTRRDDGVASCSRR